MSKQPIKVMSFNVNGLRARLDQLKTVIDKHQPHIIGLQETKVSNEEFPHQEIRALGYQANTHGQKGHYGVAFLSKINPTTVNCGFPSDSADSQCRMIHGRYQCNGKTLHLINCYFPQGESRVHPTKFPAKQQFYKDLLSYLKNHFDHNDLLVVMGDMNVAHRDADVGIKPENAKRWLKTGKCAFLPEERDWLQNLLDWGLVDSFRVANPDDNQTYSWFDYRSRGFEQEPKRGLRIDLILTSTAINDAIANPGIDLDARGHTKPSDHCPIWVDLNL